MSSLVRALRKRTARQNRRPLTPALRSWISWKLRKKENLLSRPATIDYLEFVPPIKDATDLADLSARVNWYLPGSTRTVDIYVGGREGLVPDPALAPHMEPTLVRDPGWAAQRPAGRSHLVVRKITPRTAAAYLRYPRRATLADIDFDYTGEEALFALHRAFCTTALPGGRESLDLLMSKAAPQGSAFVLATGPSAKQVDPDTVTDPVRITCNSAVRDHDLLARFRPSVIAFSDPVFHAGPSRYAAAFRKDLLAALESTDAVFVTTQRYSPPLLDHVPEIRDRLAVISLVYDPDWHWPTYERPTSRETGNVLTNLMLPVAFALANEAKIAGCDGRDPSEKYFWTHNTRTQYSDELMQAAFDAHPSFFRDQDYSDYYDRHCAQLEELLSTAEADGKRATGVTTSFIPALRKRGAPHPREVAAG